MPDSKQFLKISQSKDITLSQEINQGFVKGLQMLILQISFLSEAPLLSPFRESMWDTGLYLAASYIPILVLATVTN